MTQRLLFVQKLVSPTLPYVLNRYTNINSTKSPSSGAGNGREPSLTLHVGTVREVVCAWISVFLQSLRWRCQYWSAYVVTSGRAVKFVRLAPKFVMQDGGNTVNVILLCSCWVNKNSFPYSVTYVRCNQTNI